MITLYFAIVLFSIPSDFFDSGSKTSKTSTASKPLKSALVNSNRALLAQYGSDSESDDDDKNAPITPSSSSSATTTKTLASGIPAGLIYYIDTTMYFCLVSESFSLFVIERRN